MFKNIALTAFVLVACIAATASAVKPVNKIELLADVCGSSWCGGPRNSTNSQKVYDWAQTTAVCNGAVVTYGVKTVNLTNVEPFLCSDATRMCYLGVNALLGGFDSLMVGYSSGFDHVDFFTLGSNANSTQGFLTTIKCDGSSPQTQSSAVATTATATTVFAMGVAAFFF